VRLASLPVDEVAPA